MTKDPSHLKLVWDPDGIFRGVSAFFAPHGVEPRRLQVWKQKLVQMGGRVQKTKDAEGRRRTFNHVLAADAKALLRELGAAWLHSFRGVISKLPDPYNPTLQPYAAGSERRRRRAPYTWAAKNDSMRRGGDNADDRHHRRIPRLHHIEMDRLNFSDDDDEVDLRQPRSELEALHIARCESIFQYDPKKKSRVFTRVCNFNIAGFDLDRESKAALGPLLKDVTPETLRFQAYPSANVISVKVIESDLGYPVSVYGTVVARDIIDFRCVYLFRREREDPQIINSAEDMLTLTGPRRGLLVCDFIYFEFNLKVKGDPDEDFSKGVIEDRAFGTKPITVDLPSWLSKVELVFQPVECPVAATLQLNILNRLPNAPFIGIISAGTRNAESHIILYDGRATKGSRTFIGDDGSVPLSCNMVVVPNPRWDNEGLLVHVCIFDDEEDEGTEVTIQHPDEEHVCNHGSYELQVKVAWNFILSRPKAKHIETRASLLPQFYHNPNYGWW